MGEFTMPQSRSVSRSALPHDQSVELMRGFYRQVGSAHPIQLYNVILRFRIKLGWIWSIQQKRFDQRLFSGVNYVSTKRHFCFDR